MPGKVIQLDNILGLPGAQIPVLQKQYGKNVFQSETSRGFLAIAWGIVKEPMFILLVIACSLYFILGENSEGFLMLVAMILVATISFYQEVRSTNALKALQEFTEPKVRVVRDGKEMTILSEDLVPGDIMLLDEGMNIPADAIVLQANDLTVNESILTGESVPADKSENEEYNTLYQGTVINTGKCVSRVTASGNNTALGKLGKTVGAYHSTKTLLQLQINKFVNRLALFGLVGFFVIFLVNFMHHQPWAVSLLFALTLAMSAIPEEIPVAFSSFMALGAYKMSKLGIISRQPQIVESLGSVSVICLDKTGTITENKMQVKAIYDYASDSLVNLQDEALQHDGNVLRYAMLASEDEPFDAMEKAIWEAYCLAKNEKEFRRDKMIYEYPLEGQPPMMTHVYENGDMHVVAAKGAAERIIRICDLTQDERKKLTKNTQSFTSEGYRVIGVASAVHTGHQFPASQDEFNWKFEGLLALYDPPKKNIRDVLQQFYKANIDVKIITGDHPETAMNIAGQVGMNNSFTYITGEKIMKMKEVELLQVVKNTNVFARMFPDAKLKIIDALKANGKIVAMTGDGVNDGPALKSANIGIAMGQRGTEIARQAADLVITDDNLERIVTAIREGRKIFSNFKKAVRYIISIHIPIILTASLPVIFGWAYPNIFTPIHVIFMELIMGPTCSIFFENEPVEETIMLQVPRDKKSSFFDGSELFISIVQGVFIAAGILALYYYFMSSDASFLQTRTIVFTALILSNIFLTFTNRSFTKTISYTIRYKNRLGIVILIVSIIFLLSLHFVPFIRNLFQLTAISLSQFWLCVVVSFTSVMWFEVYKKFRK